VAALLDLAPLPELELPPEPAPLLELAPLPEPAPLAQPAKQPTIPQPSAVPLEPEPAAPPVTPEPTPVPDKPRPVPLPRPAPRPTTPLDFVPVEDPQELAGTVFGRLAENVKRIVDTGLLGDTTLFEAELRNRLADDELLNITARGLFEGRVAALLAGGWTPEAGLLFGAAASVFGWEKDSRRLQPFGQAGSFVDRAIGERTMFHGQSAEELGRQRAVIDSLRHPKRPTIVRIRRNMPHLERMLERFPTMMAIMVSADMVEDWRAQCLAPEAPPSPPPTIGQRLATPPQVQAQEASKSRFSVGWLIFALVALSQLFTFLSSNTPADYPAPSAKSSQHPVYAPGADPWAADYQRPKARPKTAPIADADARKQLVDAIIKDIRYTPASNAPYGLRTVVYDVLAAENGSIYGMNRIKRSIDPDYDEAVKAAIMRAGTLPPHTGPGMRLTFNREWSKPVRRAPAKSTPPPMSAADKKEMRPVLFGEDPAAPAAASGE
jgi:hypothetical protein